MPSGSWRRDLLAASHVLERLEQRVAGNDVEREQKMLDRGVLVAESAHLLEGLVEHAAERRRSLRLRGSARDRGLVAQTRLRLSAQLRGAVARAVDERSRQLLLEQRHGQVIWRQLGIARSARELLRCGDGLLRLEGQAIEVHRASDRSLATVCCKAG